MKKIHRKGGGTGWKEVFWSFSGIEKRLKG